MRALAAIDAWPVDDAAAALVLPAGMEAAYGDRSRAFRFASVTKLLTAYAVLVAVEEGVVDLDGPAGPPGSTVRHLLAHASGLPFEGADVLAPPGSRRIYSNTGFDLLGTLLEDQTGMPFADYVREAVLAPLGMRQTALRADGRYSEAAAGAHGTLDDLAAFAQELLAPRLVAAETLAEATSVAFPGLSGVLPGIGRQEPLDWGLGFELRDGKSPHWTGSRNSPETFGHFGGAGTFLWADPVAGAALVCLTNREFGDWALQAWPTLSDAVLEELAAGGD